PVERVKLLRDAYAKTLRDPELLAEVKKQEYDFDPVSGDELQTLAKTVVNQPAPVIERLKRILGNSDNVGTSSHQDNGKRMKPVRLNRFGPPEVISLDGLPKPEPGRGEVVVRVKAAGIGPWDALIRSGKSVLTQPLPLILGSDLSGEIDSVGAGGEKLKVGDEVFGVTNERFTGAYG